MFGRKRRALEQRIAKLEARLNGRTWDIPPACTVDIPDLPTFPDYTPGVILEDDDATWRPHGYL